MASRWIGDLLKLFARVSPISGLIWDIHASIYI